MNHEQYLLSIEGVSKSFPGVLALDDVQFNLKAGEVHALLGENGAGKSTLMKILGGVYTRDTGEYYAFGNKVGNLTPKQAEQLGIAIIHQELNLCEHLSVSENMFLGREPKKFGCVDRKTMYHESQKILDSLHIAIDPATLVSDLPVSKKQMVEIAKALSVNAKVLIMDEPTSALTDKEIEDLFAIIHNLKAQGCGIAYISHRLEELKHITDRVTVFRDGSYITTMNYHETTLDQIIQYMVGREINEQYPQVSVKRGKPILEVRNLYADMVKNVSFTLYQGEILGFSGLMGAGRTELLKALFGVNPIHSGEILLNGKSLHIKHAHHAIVEGIVLGPEDRKHEGLCTKLSIRENVGLAHMDTLANTFGVVKRKEERELTQKVIDNLQVKTPSMEQLAQNLSGGNQQKVVVGRWLARNAKVVLFDEPTRGIDVAAKVSIYQIMNKLKEQGVGVLFASSELPEVMGMSDRVIVMCNGRVTGDMVTTETTPDEIMHAATRYSNKLGDTSKTRS